MSQSESAKLQQIFYEFDQINFFLIAVIGAGAYVLALLIQKLFPRVAKRLPGRSRHYVLPLVPVLRMVIYVIAFLSIVPLIVRPTVQNFVALFGALGLALGFAFKDYVSSLLAGVVAIYEQPYRPGDWVKIGDAYGEVQSLGLRSIRIVNPDDTVITIPHAKIWDSAVENANFGKRDHLCVAEFYTHPEHAPAEVNKKLIDVALTSPYVQLNRPVSVVVFEKTWGTLYRLKAYPHDNRDEFPFITDLTVRGKQALADMGVRPARAAVAAPE